MRDGQYWNDVNRRLDTLRREADTRHQLQWAGLNNFWARLLPPLRRLESWIERHAGTPAGNSAPLHRVTAR